MIVLLFILLNYYIDKYFQMIIYNYANDILGASYWPLIV